MRLVTPTIATAAAAFALAACGEESSSDARGNASATVARTEVGKTRDALNAALVTYRGGDHAAAEDQVAEAYLSHFEEVEGPLGKRDHELNEQLEEAISAKLRADMKAGKPTAAIAAEVRAIIADLDKAEAALR